MLFPYREERQAGKSIFRPYVTVTIHGKDRTTTVDALVDSGSDHNVFSPEVAKRLSISLTNEKKVFIVGVGGKHSVGYLVPVELQLETHRWTAPMIFSSGIENRGILGQLGFFAFFTVTFRQAERSIDLTWLDNP